MNPSDYHSDKDSSSPSLSSSVAWEIEPSNRNAGSPYHGWLIHPKLGNQPKAQTADMRFGSLCHAMLLGEGKKYEVLPDEFSDYKKAAAREWRDDCIKRGVLPIKASDEKDAQECVKAWAEQINGEKINLGYLLKGQNYEKYLSWKEKTFIRSISAEDFPNDAYENGEVECRAMIDILTEDWREIWDIKTTSNVHESKIMGKILDEGLALRSEFYKRGVCKVRPELAGRVKHGFIFCSTERKHGYAVVPVYELDGRFQLIGRKQCERSIQTWGECLRTQKWNNHPAIKRAICPSWAFKDEITEDEAE